MQVIPNPSQPRKLCKIWMELVGCRVRGDSKKKSKEKNTKGEKSEIAKSNPSH